MRFIGDRAPLASSKSATTEGKCCGAYDLKTSLNAFVMAWRVQIDQGESSTLKQTGRHTFASKGLPLTKRNCLSPLVLPAFAFGEETSPLTRTFVCLQRPTQLSDNFQYESHVYKRKSLTARRVLPSSALVWQLPPQALDQDRVKEQRTLLQRE